MPITELDAIKAVLYAFSRVRTLKENYTLKGGNALKLGHGSPRASRDLDFTIKSAQRTVVAADHEKALGEFLELFNRGLAHAKTKYGMALSVTSAKVLPAKKDPRSFPSFEVKVGYAETTGTRFYTPVVKIEISLNEVVCEDLEVSIGDFAICLASLDDIVAEKLRAILQQIPRNRQRPRDFYDLWYFSTFHADKIDLNKVSGFLLAKSISREINVSRAAFENPELFERGATGFEKLRETVPKGEEFPEFAVAAAAVRAIVAHLEIPETHE